jgi:hypothetical protein
VEEVDEVIVLKPVSCPPCTQPVDGGDSASQRQQVIGIPPLRPSNHGIPNASADLSGLWHHDPRGMARRCFKRDDEFMGPSPHRVVEGDILLVEADRATGTGTGRPAWPDKRTIQAFRSVPPLGLGRLNRPRFFDRFLDRSNLA